ncbi:DNA-3-methyladenine glycosylase I [Limosilactobacillus panis]|uniref:DNA-3-methyladenine glycosylase I n=1 Tax=Limosilactobacillus panis TaxID=47493 RepID=A0ABT7VMZ5_9LACO|nr:DNA-3-methyladenine glycosylase I [Limosilactobacillus panis]MDM8334108.1 DNA-3-methyladenine glycosylase I [Limosilactobacillus panis]
MAKQRPTWAESSDLMRNYYDQLWGYPIHDDRLLFEMLTLELFQAGLSWEIIWRRRAAFEQAFDHFVVRQVASYGETDWVRLMTDAGIIRNRRKIAATINNAQVIKGMQDRGQRFADYLWAFVDHHPQRLRRAADEPMPAQTDLSRRIARQMKRDGFKFVGPTIVYSYITAVGLVNARL